MEPGRKWRRTTVTRAGRLVPLADDWSLYDAESQLEIARIFAEGDGWRWIVRMIRDNELVDGMTGWRPNGKDAREFCEAQTGGTRYIFKRKRIKSEILDRAGVRPKPKSR